MINKTILESLAREQMTEPLPSDLVTRESATEVTPLGSAMALVVKGIRRCGKSTLIRGKMEEGFKNNYLYFNFDDERISGFQASDLQSLMETLIRVFGNTKTIFFDEIQNITGWELFINRLLRQGYNVFITGSNADLLSKELGTHLTGRHLDVELWPFSFREFLEFRKIQYPLEFAPTTSETASMESAFAEYLILGGMPEAVRLRNQRVLPGIVDDIIQKDIIKRYAIRKPAELRNILRTLIATSSSRITFRSLSNNFGIKNHATIQKYLSYAQDAYLIFLVEKYEKKRKLVSKSPKKCYCSDTGIVFVFSPILEQRGALLETIVALELKRRKQTTFFYENKNTSETDFVIVESTTKRITEVIQVCYDPTPPGVMEREENALTTTLRETGLTEGLILTHNYTTEKERSGKKIRYLPVWRWLLAKRK